MIFLLRTRLFAHRVEPEGKEEEFLKNLFAFFHFQIWLLLSSLFGRLNMIFLDDSSEFAGFERLFAPDPGSWTCNCTGKVWKSAGLAQSHKSGDELPDSAAFQFQIPALWRCSWLWLFIISFLWQSFTWSVNLSFDQRGDTSFEELRRWYSTELQVSKSSLLQRQIELLLYWLRVSVRLFPTLNLVLSVFQ